MVTSQTGLTNWSGNYTYGASQVHQPSSLDDLRSIVAKAPKIRALGTRHCFNDIADSVELISLDGFDQSIEINRAAQTVSINPAMRYGILARALEAEGFALHNMASLPHISVGGAVATATHGSGDAHGNLATAVAALELVTSDGDLLHMSRGDADFNGMVVGLGALGVVTRLTLDIQPSFLVRQQIFVDLPWETLFDQFDTVMSSAYSVSLFTNYGETVSEVWLKSRVDPKNPQPTRTELLGAPAATRKLHPVPELSPENCTEQLDEPGCWADRLPHFRLDAVPASGDELQTEYMVTRQHAVAALRAVHALAPQLKPPMMISEVRTVAADDLWLSSAYGVDAVCLHFSCRSDLAAVQRILPLIEETLAPFSPRPHWGKLFVATAADLHSRYPRMDEFRRLADWLDPRGAFRNAYLERHVFG